MRFSKFCAVLVALTLAVSASATLSPSFIPVPISPDAIAADPTLANFRCYDFRVTMTGANDRWTCAGLVCQLSSGSYYSPAGGGDAPVVATSPNFAYDTWVTVPGYAPGSALYPASPLVVLGRETPVQGAAIFPRVGEQQNTFDVVWGTLPAAAPDNTYTVARLTISNDAAGTITGEALSSGNLIGAVPVWQPIESSSFALGTLLGASVPGDANHSGKVDSADFVALAQHFNHTGTTWESGDFNSDGKTTALDFNALATNFGATSASALGAVVPEPANIMMLGIVAMIATRRRANPA